MIPQDSFVLPEVDSPEAMVALYCALPELYARLALADKLRLRAALAAGLDVMTTYRRAAAILTGADSVAPTEPNLN